MSATAVGELLAALVVIITLARVFGALARRCGQPAVVGEILAGVVLGPTFFGAGLANHLFPVISARVPDDALIVARQDGSHAGSRLVVRAGPGYDPAEPVPFVVAGERNG
jgi:hypothetical protein